MGGNALHIETVRLGKEAYEELKTDVLHRLETYVNDVMVPMSYHNKPDFGDLDVIMNYDGNMRELIIQLFNPTEIYKNDKVYSFDYKDFQVDFIQIPKGEMDIAYHYYSYNDMGNLLGRLSKVFGLKFGSDGLKYVHYNEDKSKKLGEVYLTKDFKRILNLLRLSHDRYLEGFDELEDIYEFIVSSPFFCEQYFRLDFGTATSRNSDSRRKVFNGFSNYVLENSVQSAVYYNSKRDRLKMVASLFPDAELYQKIEQFDIQEAKRKEVVAKFSGHVVMDWYPQLNGKALGIAIKKFYASFQSTEQMQDWVLQNSDKNIRKRFDSLFN